MTARPQDQGSDLRASGGGPRPFHLALPVHDLGAAEAFYAGTLGAGVGRRSDRWIDFDLGGHQITVHRVPGPPVRAEGHSNPVDGDAVPIPHFGIVLTMDAWRALAAALEAAECAFVIPPRVRFEGLPGERGTLFLRDPSGNALEFKGFRDDSGLFDDAGAY